LNLRAVKLILAPGIIFLSLSISGVLRAQDPQQPNSVASAQTSQAAQATPDKTPASPADSAQATQPAQPAQGAANHGAEAANPAATPAPAATEQPTSTAAGQPGQLPTPPTPIALIPPAPTERPISWFKLPRNFLDDQKEIWLFPGSIVHGHHWKPVVVFAGVTAALVAGVDTPSGRFFQRSQGNFKDFNGDFRDSHTASALFAFPVMIYGVGFFRHDSYMERTVELTAEAALDSTVVSLVMKDISRRVQPDQVAADGNFADTWFKEHGRVFGGIGSFPCGHCIEAFSIATVFANRYPRYKWAAYGLAGFVAFTRLSLQAHNVSDDFAGAFLAYVIAHYTVERLN